MTAAAASPQLRRAEVWRSRAKATWLCYSQALAVELLYRFPLLQGFLSVGVGLVGLALFWTAAGHGSAAEGIYQPSLLLAYFILAAAHSLLQENRLGAALNAAIRMGGLSASLLRPYPYLLGALAQVAAHATVRLVLLTATVLGLFKTFAVLTPVAAELTLTRLLLYAAALVIGVASGWLCKIAIGLLAFDMTQTWGPELIFLALFSALSGASYPADLLGTALAPLVTWTPVYYMVGFPTLLLLGRLSSEQIYHGLSRGGLVLAVTAALVAWMWQRGIKRFEATSL